jgi:hypothetical protein
MYHDAIPRWITELAVVSSIDLLMQAAYFAGIDRI